MGGTGVQTCALPIYAMGSLLHLDQDAPVGNRELGSLPAHVEGEERAHRDDHPREPEERHGPGGELVAAHDEPDHPEHEGQIGRATGRERAYERTAAAAWAGLEFRRVLFRSTRCSRSSTLTRTPRSVTANSEVCQRT